MNFRCCGSGELSDASLVMLLFLRSEAKQLLLRLEPKTPLFLLTSLTCYKEVKLTKDVVFRLLLLKFDLVNPALAMPIPIE